MGGINKKKEGFAAFLLYPAMDVRANQK